MEEKNKNFLPKLSEPVVRPTLGVKTNSEEDLFEEELTLSSAAYQGGITPSSLAIGCVLALCSPFAGDNAD